MALFNIAYINHGEVPLAAEDMMTYLQCALREAGHDVYINPTVQGGAINILIEGFGDGSTAVLCRYAAMGVKIVVVATETVTNGTFNDFGATDNGVNWYTGWYSRHEAWDRRYRNFLKVAEACKTIWCLSQHQLNGYASIIPGSWLHLLPFGYLQGYRSVQQKPDHLKDIDFAFTGIATEHRERVVAELSQKGFRAVLFRKLLPAVFRRNILSRTKVCLGLKQFPEWKHSSLLRNYYHLMNGNFLLAEACAVPSSVDNYIEVADPSRLIGACIDAVARPNLSEIAAANRDRFREQVPLKPLFRKLLEKSLGLGDEEKPLRLVS